MIVQYAPRCPTEGTGKAIRRHSTKLESRRAVRDEGRAHLGHAMRQRELEFGREQLPDVRAADVLSLFDLHNSENLG